jgi:hypothetical protein
MTAAITVAAEAAGSHGIASAQMHTDEVSSTLLEAMA